MIRSITRSTTATALLTLLIPISILVGSSSVLNAQDKDVLEINNSIKNHLEKYGQMSEAELFAEWNKHEKDILLEFGEETYYPGLSPERKMNSLEDLIKDPGSVISVWGNMLPAISFKIIIKGNAVDKQETLEFVYKTLPSFLVLTELFQIYYPDRASGFINAWQKKAKETTNVDISLMRNNLEKECKNINKDQMLTEGREEMLSFVKKFEPKVPGDISPTELIKKATERLNSFSTGGFFASEDIKTTIELICSRSVSEFVEITDAKNGGSFNSYFSGKDIESKLAKARLVDGADSKTYKLIEKIRDAIDQNPALKKSIEKPGSLIK